MNSYGKQNKTPITALLSFTIQKRPSKYAGSIPATFKGNENKYKRNLNDTVGRSLPRAR
jgi:hypothetical protein